MVDVASHFVKLKIASNGLEDATTGGRQLQWGACTFAKTAATAALPNIHDHPPPCTSQVHHFQTNLTRASRPRFCSQDLKHFPNVDLIILAVLNWKFPSRWSRPASSSSHSKQRNLKFKSCRVVRLSLLSSLAQTLSAKSRRQLIKSR